MGAGACFVSGVGWFSVVRLALYLRGTCATWQTKTRTANQNETQTRGSSGHSITKVWWWSGAGGAPTSFQAPRPVTSRKNFANAQQGGNKKETLVRKCLDDVWKSGGGVGTGFSLHASSPLLVASQALTPAIRRAPMVARVSPMRPMAAAAATRCATVLVDLPRGGATAPLPLRRGSSL